MTWWRARLWPCTAMRSPPWCTSTAGLARAPRPLCPHTARAPSTGWLASHVGIPCHLAQLIVAIGIGRPAVHRCIAELVYVPARQHLFPRGPVNPLVGDFVHPFRNSVLKSIRHDGSRPSSPHTKLRRTYFTPDSILPLVWARYGRHSRGVKPQYRAKSRNTGCQRSLRVRRAQPHRLHPVVEDLSGIEPHSRNAASCIRSSVPSF